MSDQPAEAAAPPRPPGDAPPRGRRARLLLKLAIVLGALALLLHWASRPERVASVVMEQAGRALGLEITAEGISEYHLRGHPQIVLREVTARLPDDPVPVLRADRIALSLPWSTLRSRGGDLVVHRVEVDEPHVDVAAVRRWLATRPEAPAPRIPRLTDGFVVRDGRIAGDGWSIAGLALAVPRLGPGEPVRAKLGGRFLAPPTSVPFDLYATLSSPSAGAGLGVAGELAAVRPDWRLHLGSMRLRGVPSAADGALRLDSFVLGANAALQQAGQPESFVLGLAGDAVLAQRLQLSPVGMVLRQGDRLPDFDASGRIAWGDALELSLGGVLAAWPDHWPRLPAPIDASDAPIPARLAYAGPADLTGSTQLHLRRGPTTFDARFELPELLAWQVDRGSPIPPLDGRLATPRLVFDGAVLEGVEVEIDAGE